MKENVILGATQTNLLIRNILNTIFVAEMERTLGSNWFTELKQCMTQSLNSQDDEQRKLAKLKINDPSLYQSENDFDTTLLTYMMLNDPIISQYFGYDQNVNKIINKLRYLRNHIDHKKDRNQLTEMDLKQILNNVDSSIRELCTNLDAYTFNREKAQSYLAESLDIRNRYIYGGIPSTPPVMPKIPDQATNNKKPSKRIPLSDVEIFIVVGATFALLVLGFFMINPKPHGQMFVSKDDVEEVEYDNEGEETVVDQTSQNLPVTDNVTDAFQLTITNIEQYDTTTRIYFHAVNQYMADVLIDSTNLQCNGQTSSIKWGTFSGFQLSDNTIPMNSEFDFYLDYDDIKCEPGQEITFNCNYMHGGLESSGISGSSSTMSFIW